MDLQDTEREEVLAMDYEPLTVIGQLFCLLMISYRNWKIVFYRLEAWRNRGGIYRSNTEAIEMKGVLLPFACL